MTSTQTPQNPTHRFGTKADGTPILENSLEHQMAVRDARLAQENAARDWAALLRRDPKAAAKAFLAPVSDYTRKAYLKELEGTELTDFARGVKSEQLLAAIYQACNDPRLLRIELIPDDALPKFVRVQRGGLLAANPHATDDADIDAATARQLTDAGIAVSQSREYQAIGPRRYRRRGWNPSASMLDGTGHEIHAEAKWNAMVAADPQLAAQVQSGALRVDALPASHARGLMRRGEI